MALSKIVVMGGLSPKYGLHPSSVGRFEIGKQVVRAHAISNNPTLLSTTLSHNDSKTKFMQVFDSLKWEIFHDPSFEFDDDSRQYVERMIDYNIPGGKFNRIHTVVDTYKVLKGQELTDEEFFLACALGWCSQWQHGFILVTDDLIDDCDIRRGQICWYRLPEVGLISANDALVLRNHIFIILRKYFKRKAFYVELRDLFDEVEYQTISGQMIDMITTLEEKNLSKFSGSTNQRILQYKTSYGSFYLPFACALLMAGENLSDHALVKDVLIKMGIYFSVQDDYLDAFGDPKVTGKTGVDIENFKCSWVVTKALELANEEQKKIINENYGINDPEKVAIVKELYDTLNLQGEYEDYGNKIYKELIKSIETHPSKAVQQALKSFLERIHKRQK